MSALSVGNLAQLASDGALRVALGSRSPAKLGAVAAALDQLRAQARADSGAAPLQDDSPAASVQDDSPTPRLQTDSAGAPFRTELVGVAAASGVADQPWGEEQTRQGALNRALGALAAEPSAALAVGIEAGVLEEPGWPLWTFAWVVALDRSGKRGAARSATFGVPELLAGGVRAGLELGDALDAAYGLERAKDGPGAVGVLTGGLIDRPELYRAAVLLALLPWLAPTAGGTGTSR